VDFAYAYTEEQQRFRQEVRDWIAKNVPEEMKDPNDGRDFTEEQWRFWREKHIEMGAMGWLFPTYPSEYGGGGLSGDHEAILAEEFREAQIPWSGSSLLFATLLVWGTEEQRQKFLVPLLKGEKTSWQKLTEPKGGADLANYQSRAVRDGDDWLLTGQNVFIGAHGETEWLFGPMLTDPDAPRHRNLGFFMIPVPSEGLQIREMDLLIGHRKRSIFLDNVRVPGDHLIGGDHQGWQVANTSLEQEHGGRGRAFPRDKVVDSLVEYTKGTEQDGRPLGSDPMVQQTTMNNVIEAHVQSLLLKRTFWMYQSQMHINYEGNVANVHNREHDIRNAGRVRDVMGMYSLVDRNEPGSPHGGAQEVNQRGKAGQRHAGGSTNIAKVILARRIGISRTKERAAPTPSTATSHGS
jgi:alkylation response protein AidB-like acyl-CoA dehydrogenase